MGADNYGSTNKGSHKNLFPGSLYEKQNQMGAVEKQY